MFKKALHFIKTHKRICIPALIAAALLIVFLFIRPSGVKTFLVLGMDNYGSLNSTDGRSDVTMLVQIDFDRANIKAVSFARDMFIKDERGYDAKINTIVKSTSEDQMVSVIEQNFGVDIDGWFRVNFASVVLLVDALGGANVELTAAEAKYIDRQIGEYSDHPLSEGVCLLNGEQALTYARCRKLDNDIGRGQRQSKLVAAMVAQTRKLSVSKIVGIYHSLQNMWRSSLSSAEQAKLLSQALWLRGAKVEGIGMPFEGYWHYGSAKYGGSGIVANIEENRRLLLEALGYPAE